jgi:hypothetical protein
MNTATIEIYTVSDNRTNVYAFFSLKDAVDYVEKLHTMTGEIAKDQLLAKVRSYGLAVVFDNRDDYYTIQRAIIPNI